MSAGAEASGSAPSAGVLRMLPLIATGGAIGTAAREGLTLAFPAVDGVPFAILGVNLVGAFLLGLLVEALARRGPDTGRRRTVRLTLGTGVLGGFTTYSALSTDTALLLLDGRWTVGTAYALGSVVIGAGMTVAGIVVAAAHHRWADGLTSESDR